ncbi:DUF2785 domain-containing protein [Ornithinibacillus xuwenensis]|uniref:DUF2785 domain-containing protein n=1 Tax=Ornithinibacillus xuwenensis TaxID=3144668 RepID=A0ABU9XKX9_9BACI
MNANELKLLLEGFRASDFQQQGSMDIGMLTNAMLEHIGSTDPDLRDLLIYPCFSTLLINGNYPPPELNRILTICLDEKHLFYRIGEVHGDGVFTRSFSSLIIAVLLHINLRQSFLADEQVEEAAVKLLDYVEKETDIRGFVEGKGWAHSIAHIADTLDELVKQPQLTEGKRREIAGAILNKMSFDKGYYLFEEDERMVIPMVSLLQTGIDQDFLYESIKQIADDLQVKFAKDATNLFIYRTNMKQFFKSLLIHLEVIHKHEELQKHIKDALKIINQPYYNV